MVPVESVVLNDGHNMPKIGQGVYQLTSDQAESMVKLGYDLGYRAVDTAAWYDNEQGVGDGLRSIHARSFLTTKLMPVDMGRINSFVALDRSIRNLGVTNIDLYLIHWPGRDRKRYEETWQTFIEIRAIGKASSVGVSNFTIDNLDHIIEASGVVPAVNQIELHPYFQQKELRAYHAERGIITTSWSPLGRGAPLDDPVIRAIALKHGRTPAQVVLNWHLRLGLTVIPKASSKARLQENLASTEFSLDEEDMKQIEALDRPDGRQGMDPAVFDF
ncbi:MAG: aldo/keto reductase [Zymomonas mobilis subsp. pomaceae]|uniref:Aldo/keto reductase n=1 Tax=Zymomonas mobilis subsp. pomaceae (strain ATCC 29192 / DSM 22645 / JCM 10191 / CCUG 17912 / NBRC 13757 / NCIMB 11200 / NRRL B-4491 / Barker I) TaxID=579138 RepID=F8EVJ6_ZYMMT|nr:aldo/keto reductase [Zymomonas mobilis]AEI38333.1 aldo/keto reductase [Zymomonas mobilis subsp. pomaceae ATCC 29192]MDX5948022.1 aldo/keto reductase [Zymomonas mobilis subsp. pomaceae]GEB89352.1 oxidoreductase [Zymomonas mobilis subsp. pomaceae]